MLRIGTSEVNICQKSTDTQQKPAIPLLYFFSYGGGYGANLFCACYFQHFSTLRKRGTGGLYVVCKKYCFAVKILKLFRCREYAEYIAAPFGSRESVLARNIIELYEHLPTRQTKLLTEPFCQKLALVKFPVVFFGF